MLKSSKIKFAVANWKMNPESLRSARDIFSKTRRYAEKYKRKVRTIICPPTFFLGDFSKFRKSSVALGAQDAFFETSGAYTGETSPTLLRREGISYVIIGHSERRALGEVNEIINKKVLTAFSVGLSVILCVGESKRDRDGEYLSFIKEEIKSALSGVKQKDLKNLIVAYEPIWAIGKNETEAMRSEDVHEMVIFIRKILSDLYKKINVFSIPVLYGGSVGAMNAKDLVEFGQVDGFLVGHMSLDPKNFSEIIATLYEAN